MAELLRWDVGEDDFRLRASQQRLLRSDYDPAAVLAYSAADSWPGDKAGRLLLALAHHERLTGVRSERAAKLVSLLPAYLNRWGYFGKKFGDPVDEQQLAGHSWLVSGLILAGEIDPSGPARELARPIIEDLLLPGIAALGHYPIDARSSSPSGAAIGTLREIRSGWRLSTDVFCVLIAMDGLLSALAFDQDARLDQAMRALLELLAGVDLQTSGAQLHASLTAARCALGYGRRTGNADAIALGARVYDAWSEKARTVNWGCLNWFGRPDSWTEPCAMVDAALAAFELWRLTGQVRYLDDVHMIEHSALGHAQKAHGGFGLDTCAGPGNPFLGCVEVEAPWCCTLRGAVGLAELRRGTYRVVDAGLRAELFHAGDATVAVGGGTVTLRQLTDYPRSGRVSIEVIRFGVKGPVRLEVAVPSWGQAVAPAVLAQVGDQVHFDLGMPERVVVDDSGVARFLGPTLLGENEDGKLVEVSEAFGWSVEVLRSRRLRVVD